MPTPTSTRHPIVWLTFAASAFAAGLVCGGVWMRVPAETSARRMPAEASRLVAAAAGRGTTAGSDDGRTGRLSEALAIMDSGRRLDRLRSLARSLASHDGASAWSQHEQISGLADREEYCVEVLRIWAETNPPEAWERALALPAGRLRTACTSAALEGWARMAPAEALSMAARALSGTARESAVASVVATWAASEAQAAANWSANNVSTPGAAGALRAALESWADNSPAAASQWVAGLPPGDTFTAAANALVGAWGRQSPVAAATWLSAQGAAHAIDAPAAALAAEWAASEPAAATEWAASLGRTLTAREAATRALGEWAAVAPVDAAAWLADKGSGLASISPALHDSLGASWAGHDPAGAATWLGTLSDPLLRGDTAVPVFNTWAALDVAGLAEWINHNQQSPVVDEARAQLALTQSDFSPADAIAVALEVSAQEDAADLGRRILDDWRLRDLVSADQWMVANPQAAAFIEPLE